MLTHHVQWRSFALVCTYQVAYPFHAANAPKFINTLETNWQNAGHWPGLDLIDRD
jgi:hypothetical protein